MTNNKLIESPKPERIQLESNNRWKFNPIKNMGSAGIYSAKDLIAYRQSVNQPLSFKAMLNNLDRTLRGQSKISHHYTISNAFNLEDIERISSLKEKIKNSIKSSYEKFIALRNHVSAAVAIVCVIGFIKFVIESLFNGYAIYAALGLSWRILLGCFDSVTRVFINSADTVAKEFDERVNRGFYKKTEVEPPITFTFNPSAPERVVQMYPKITINPLDDVEKIETISESPDKMLATYELAFKKNNISPV